MNNEEPPIPPDNDPTDRAWKEITAKFDETSTGHPLREDIAGPSSTDPVTQVGHQYPEAPTDYEAELHQEEPSQEEPGKRWGPRLGAGAAIVATAGSVGAAVVFGIPAASGAVHSIEAQAAAAEVVERPVTTPFINGEVVLRPDTVVTQDTIYPTTGGSAGVNIGPVRDARGNPATQEELGRPLVVDQPMIIATEDGRRVVVFALPGSDSENQHTVLAEAPISYIESVYGPHQGSVVVQLTGMINSGSKPDNIPTSVTFPDLPNGFGSARDMAGPNDAPTAMRTSQGQEPLVLRGGAAEVATALDQQPPSRGFSS